jgi:signal peptidase I
MTTITDPIRSEIHVAEPYSRARLTAGILGRAWLWFWAGCLAVTLIPILLGWHSYVIVTGSMEPAVNAGDVVLASPDPVIEDSIGRVISFEDPARPGHVLTHRLISINDDGTLVTKGDANPTPDTVAVPRDSVTGLGRLLVQFVGLPVVWYLTGQWLLLLLVIAVTVGAVVATVLDYEPDNHGRRPWQRRIDQRQPGDPKRLLSRSAPSITPLLILVMAISFAVGGDTTTPSSAAFSAVTTNTADGWTIPNWSYTTEVNNLGPYLYWKLDETGNAGSAADASGNGRTGTYSPNGNGSNFTRLADGALITDTPDRAVTLASNNACINTAGNNPINAPQVFTVIAWFRAPASYNNGGKMIGFERPRTGVQAPTGGAYDRHLYMDGQGRVWFGVYNGAHVALSSGTGLNNDQWHMAVGTQDGSGMRLYIDAVQVGSNTNTVAETQTGWWRAGCGNLSGWGDQWGGNNDPGTDSGNPQNRPFRASLDEVTVYSGTALTPQQVSFLYWAR